jgi:hypothetical protein
MATNGSSSVAFSLAERDSALYTGHGGWHGDLVGDAGVLLTEVPLDGEDGRL